MDAMILSHQWATRPDDQRFTSMQALHDHNLAKRAAALEVGAALDHTKLAVSEGGDMALVVPDQQPAQLTHWSFGQLCSRVGAPAGYLRSLPAALAAIPLQWSIEAERQDAKLLYRQGNGHPAELQAVTSDTYGRIYDADVTQAILKHIDLEQWKVPSASYASSNPRKATTLYASDRDVFVCLVNEQTPVQVPGDNGEDTLFRGFLVRNSEVGAATLEMSLFLYRRICDNRIIHGLGQSQTLRIRHTSGGPMRFVRELQPELKRYLTAGTTDMVGTILAAKRHEVGKTSADVQDWLAARGFTKVLSHNIVEAAEHEEGNPRTVWSVVQGAAAIARDMTYNDERYELERRAGKLLDGIRA